MQYGTQIGSLLTRAETQRLVVDLYKQGMPIKEIAAQVPVCLATVYRWINLPKHKNVKQKAEPKTEDSSAGCDSKKSGNTDNINSETALLLSLIHILQTEYEVVSSAPNPSEIGIDMGVKRFATLSNGDFVEPLNAFKQEQEKLAKLQRKLAKMCIRDSPHGVRSASH